MEDIFDIALKIIALLFIFGIVSMLFLPLIEKIISAIPVKESKLLEKLSQKDEETRELFKQKEKLTSLLEEKQKELEKKNKQLSSLEEKYQKVHAENVLNQPEIEYLNRKVYRLQAELEEATNQLEALEETPINVEEFKKQVQSLSDDLQTARILYKEGLEQLRNVFSPKNIPLNHLLERVNDGKLNSAFGTGVEFTNIEIIADAPPSNKNSTGSYLVTLFDCTCPAYTKGKEKGLPCKHMLYLAYELGILQIDREQCHANFKYSIENATKVAPLPKSKKEAETAKRKLSQL